MSKDAIPDVWLPLVVGDYLKDTSRLTTEQHGAYLLMIMDYWVKGPPPDDDAVLASITRLAPAKWRACRRTLEPYFRIEAGVWRQKRVDQELARWSEKKAAYARRASAAAEKRWAAEERVKGATRSERLARARSRGTHTEAEWTRLVAHFGACVKCGHGGELVKDHILPVYRGGSDAIGNIQPLCRSCNAGKSGDETDYRGPGWWCEAPTKTPAKRMPNAFPASSSTEVEAPNRASTLCGPNGSFARLDGANAPPGGPVDWAALVIANLEKQEREAGETAAL